MKDDMLVQYTKGAHERCIVRSETVISNFIDAKSINGSFEIQVISKLSEIMAADLLKLKRVDIRIADDPMLNGKRVGVQLFCLTSSELDTMIKEIFEMGKIAGQQKGE